MRRLLLLLFLFGCGSAPTYDDIALEKYEQANLLFDQGRFADCIDRYEYVVLWRDRILDAYPKLAICYERTGRTDRAVETMERMLKVEPYHVEGLRKSSDLYERHGNVPKAIELTRRILERHPEDAGARATLERLEKPR